MKRFSPNLIHVGARVAIGIFLIVAAGLKAQGLLVDPLKSELLGIPAGLQIFAIELELLLGLWLLSAWRQRWALAASLIFFAVVSCVAIRQVLDKQTTCGCFGAVDVHPGAVLALDLSLVLTLSLLLYFYPNEPVTPIRSSILQQIAVNLAVISLLIALRQCSALSIIRMASLRTW